MTAKAQLSRGWVSVARCTAWFCVMRASSRCALPSRGRIHARVTRLRTCSPFSAPRFSLAWVPRRCPGSLRHRFDGSECTSPKPWSALGTRCNRKTGCVPVSAGWWRPSRATPAEPYWRTLMKVPGMTMRSPGRESTGTCFHRSSDRLIRPERSTSRDELFDCVTGASDTAAAIAGLGLSIGDGFTAVGSGSQTVSLVPQPTGGISHGTHLFATAGAPGSGWYRIGAVQNAGIALRQALTWLDATAEQANAALDQGVQASDPLFVPYVAGERTPFVDPGLRGAWHGLGLDTSREAMLRSVVEGVAHAVALGIDAVLGAGAPLPDPLPSSVVGPLMRGSAS